MNSIEITNLDMPELLPYSQISERQLLHYNEPQAGLFVAESPNVIKRALEAGYAPVSFLIEKTQLSGAMTEVLDVIRIFQYILPEKMCWRPSPGIP